MHFTFAPRHRQAIQTRPFPLWRSVIFIIGMACLGVWLMLAGMGVAHADTSGLRSGVSNQTYELRAAAERLNSECRDNPRAVGACAARDGLLAQLKAGGACWNAKAATPAALWVPCPSVDRTLAACAAQASKLDAITRFRDTAVPPAHGRGMGLLRGGRARGLFGPDLQLSGRGLLLHPAQHPGRAGDDVSREPLKTGDLCQLLPGGAHHQTFVGQIHVLGVKTGVFARHGFPEAWTFDPPIWVNGSILCWAAQHLRKLGNPGDDEVDEISTRREVMA